MIHGRMKDRWRKIIRPGVERELRVIRESTVKKLETKNKFESKGEVIL